MHISKNKWYKFLWAKEAAPLLFPVTFCLGFSSYLGYMTPQLIKGLIDSYGDWPALKSSITLLGLLFAGEYVSRLGYQLSINKYLQHLILKVRTECYQRWLLSYEIKKGDHSLKERYPLGEVLARTMSDTEAVRELVTSGSLALIIDLVYIGSSLFGFLKLNSHSGLFLMGAEVVAALALIWGSRYMARIFYRVRKANGHLARTLADMTAGFAKTYYTCHAKFASQKGKVSFSEFVSLQLRANVWDASYYSLAESLYPIFLVLVVLVLPYSHIKEVAIIAALIDLIQRSINPIKDVAGKMANIQRAFSGIYRIREFIDDLEESFSSPLKKSTLSSRELDSFDVTVDFFKYHKSDFSLHDIHFKAFPGQLVGIIGPSGSGKSTLLQIMTANLIPEKANLLLNFKDGEKVLYPGQSENDVIQYKEQVSIVSQDSHIFSESLYFNVSLNPEKMSVDFEDFWQKILTHIPYLKEWGVTPQDHIGPRELSLGQKQLISGLRATYLRHPVVFFDEISSSLDSRLEQALRELVLLIQKQSLTFIVAHRIETILQANLILVMDHGRVVAQGSHQELSQSSQLYQSLIKELN